MSGLRLEGVKVVRGGKTLLDVASLEIREKRVTVLLGNNGAGKTTLVRLLAGIEPPTAGTVRPAPSPRASAVAFQEAVFFSGSVRSNLELALEIRGHAREIRERLASEWAERLGVTALLERDPDTLSGGERQRASLARTLALEAPLVLLDEPLGAVDERTRLDLLAQLPGLLRAREATCVVVTHRREEALALADDLVLLEGGRVLASGSARALVASPPDVSTAFALGYFVVEVDGSILAVPPASMTIGGSGAHRFRAVVLQVIEWQGHREVLIRPKTGSGLRRLSVSSGEAVTPGAEIDVSSPIAIPIPRR